MWAMIPMLRVRLSGVLRIIFVFLVTCKRPDLFGPAGRAGGCYRPRKRCSVGAVLEALLLVQAQKHLGHQLRTNRTYSCKNYRSLTSDSERTPCWIRPSCACPHGA